MVEAQAVSAKAGKIAKPRTAVLVVHGMGNQRPLKTVRAIVDALYGHVRPQGQDAPRQWWTKLDRDIADIDLPVIVTAPIDARDGLRVVDFHECYWAPLMAEARFVAVPMWLFELVRKGPWTMPSGVRPLWFVFGALLALWIVSAVLLGLTAICMFIGLEAIPTHTTPLWAKMLPWIGAAMLCFATMHWRGVLLLGLDFALLYLGHMLVCDCNPLPNGHLPMGLEWPGAATSPYLIVAIFALTLFLLMNWFFLLTVVGDAARYLRAAPSNIDVRRKIRSMAVEMLARLHAANWEGVPKYDRIIIVSHSLGTVVAYDMLRAYWGHVSAELGDPQTIVGGEGDGEARPDGRVQDNFAREDDPQPVLDQLTLIGLTPAERAEWHSRARRVLRGLDKRMLERGDAFKDKLAKRWIVSDFITMGSPLAQATFLLAEGGGEGTLQRSFDRKRREREFPTSPAPLSSDRNLSFTSGSGERLFHHGALFGLTRWTNLFFPVRGILWGDLVGGAARPLFGCGVKDVPVKGGWFGSFLGHTAYWRSKGPTTVKSGNGETVVDYALVEQTVRPTPGEPRHHLAALRDAVDLWDSASDG